MPTGVGAPGESGSKVTSRPEKSTAVHRPPDGQAMLESVCPLSTATGVGVPGASGSNVTSCPAPSTAVHWCSDGQATACSSPRSIGDGAGAPGAVGSNVTSCPAGSTAVHWCSDGHATPASAWPTSIVTGAKAAFLVDGSNVTSCPSLSTAVHCVVDGQATCSMLARSIVVAAGLPGRAGSNVISWPSSSTVVHWPVDGQAMSVNGWAPLVVSARIGPDHDGAAPAAAGRPSASAAANAHAHGAPIRFPLCLTLASITVGRDPSPGADSPPWSACISQRRSYGQAPENETIDLTQSRFRAKITPV